jgi:hypothetical protein
MDPMHRSIRQTGAVVAAAATEFGVERVDVLRVQLPDREMTKPRDQVYVDDTAGLTPGVQGPTWRRAGIPLLEQLTEGRVECSATRFRHLRREHLELSTSLATLPTDRAGRVSTSPAVGIDSVVHPQLPAAPASLTQ